VFVDAVFVRRIGDVPARCRRRRRSSRVASTAPTESTARRCRCRTECLDSGTGPRFRRGVRVVPGWCRTAPGSSRGCGSRRRCRCRETLAPMISTSL
jgi:hypothetical protein